MDYKSNLKRIKEILFILEYERPSVFVQDLYDQFLFDISMIKIMLEDKVDVADIINYIINQPHLNAENIKKIIFENENKRRVFNLWKATMIYFLEWYKKYLRETATIY